jgi:uncharacterized protein YndB with AHSA1/START domain
VFHYGMSAPNGMTMWGRFVYRDLAAPERLAFVVSFSDETGGITRHPMSATWPLQVLNVITFTESGGKTAMIIEGGPVAATPEEIATFAGAREMVQKGFDGTMEQLNAHLAQAQGKQ